jgi:phosphotransferase system HPr (HPr) family protein
MTCSDKVVVRQPYGLHLRAAVKLILVSRKYKSRITLKNGRARASAESILGIMNLGAAHGTELEVVSEGADAGEALQEIRGFFDHPQSWS